MITVLNRKSYPKFSENQEYIGRPSPLGNPYKIGPDGTRDEVIEKYRDWLRIALDPESDTEQFHRMRAEFVRLCIGYSLDGELTLVCWCAPLPCHGDVLAELIEYACRNE